MICPPFTTPPHPTLLLRSPGISTPLAGESSSVIHLPRCYHHETDAALCGHAPSKGRSTGYVFFYIRNSMSNFPILVSQDLCEAFHYNEAALSVQGEGGIMFHHAA